LCTLKTLKQEIKIKLKLNYDFMLFEYDESQGGKCSLVTNIAYLNPTGTIKLIKEQDLMVTYQSDLPLDPKQRDLLKSNVQNKTGLTQID